MTKKSVVTPLRSSSEQGFKIWSQSHGTLHAHGVEDLCLESRNPKRNPIKR